MATTGLKVLVLGSVPEVGNIFSRKLFTEDLPATAIHVPKHEDFVAAIDRDELYNVVLIDITPYGLEVLEQVRRSRPASPVIAISNVDQADLLLQAKRRGLEGYLIRGASAELFTDLLAEELYSQLVRYAEPPTMAHPSADEMYRYAQYHNVLEPFFVIAQKRYLMYINKAGSDLIESVTGTKARIGDATDAWGLEETLEEFQSTLESAFAGHEAVHERRFSGLAEGLRELHYQPVTDPAGRVVAVSICVHQPARPELQRAWFMQKTADLLAWISHENNNLLNILMSNADLLSIRLAELGDEQALNQLHVIERAIERSILSTQQMQAFSGIGVVQPENLDLNALIEGLQTSLKQQLATTIELIFEPNYELPELYADRHRWETVVKNLVRNGADEMVDGGQIRIRTRLAHITPKSKDKPVEPGYYVILEFLFDGQIMADRLQDRRFDPFFTLRKREGYGGLELAAAKNIIDQAGGQVTVDYTEHQTVLQVYYPVIGSSR